jgi:hypothetical protein
MRTWHFEWIVVAAILIGVNVAAGHSRVEWIGAGAVLLSFGHAAITDRMAERQSLMSRPDVDCWRWSVRYFIAKEALWVAYFISMRSYSALVGCGVFLVYPIWRRWYRRWRPLDRAALSTGGKDNNNA